MSNTVIISQEVQQIIERLKNRNDTNPSFNKQIIEESFNEHFKLLGLKSLPFKYFNTAKEAYKYVWSAAWSAARSAARSAAWSAAESAARSAARSAAWSAAESAAWSAAWLNCKSKDAKNYGYIWLPFVDAFENGLWLFWVTEREVVICLSPSLSIKNGNLHNENGAAVSFNGEEEYYFLNGVKMEKWHVMTKANEINPKDIIKEINVDVRRELIRKVGIERVIEELPTTLLDKQGNYELYNVVLSEEVPNARYLKMLNPSVGCFHLEGVEGNTVQEAINFRARNILKNNENWNPSILT